VGKRERASGTEQRGRVVMPVGERDDGANEQPVRADHHGAGRGGLVGQDHREAGPAGECGDALAARQRRVGLV